MSADDEQFVDGEPEGLGDEFDARDADPDDGIVPDDYDELDDDDSDDEDDEDDDFDDDYDDATEEEIDFVVALYREDGVGVATELAPQLANDLEELVEQLRRLPGDAGALGVVSIDLLVAESRC